MHPGLGGVRGQPGLRAGAGNLLRLLHGEDRSAASASCQARYSGVQPRLCRRRSPGHLLGGGGREGNESAQSQPQHKVCVGMSCRVLVEEATEKDILRKTSILI